MRDEELREPSFLVLTALVQGPRHGYALLGEIEKMSQGRVRLRTSTLYAALDRLATEGLIRAVGSEVVDGRTRRLFSLTAAGRELLVRATARMTSNAAEAARRLGGAEALL